MYFSGQITVDPSQLTEIAKVKPTKGFAKMAFFLSGGLASQTQEHETFTAVTILQQINIVMRSLGVNNIVKLAKDDVIFYEDKEGRQDDLKETLQRFAKHANRPKNKLFDTLSLVLEHESADLRFLIEIRVNRSHEVGEYPITVRVNGFLTKFQSTPGESVDQLKARMEDDFQAQSDYDAIVESARLAFERFLDDIENGFQQHMKVDSVHRRTKTKILRSPFDSGMTLRERSDIAMLSAHDYDPVFYGYHGYDDLFLYACLWSNLCQDHEIHCQDVFIVDEAGQELMYVDSNGLDMGSEAITKLGAEEAQEHVPALASGGGGGSSSPHIDTSDSSSGRTTDSGGGGWFSDLFGGGDGGGFFGGGDGGGDGGGGDGGGGCGGGGCGGCGGGGCGGG